jgi:hypothetical protein
MEGIPGVMGLDGHSALGYTKIIALEIYGISSLFFYTYMRRFESHASGVQVVVVS